MPAIFAHYAYGKKVYRSLPEDLKQIVRNYKTEFVNGLQGPDPLFFFNPVRDNKVSELGHTIHREKASVFLNPALKVLAVTGLDSPEGAYILGFICHYMLDSSCHEYIGRMVKETGICHTEQETEFDRYMMEAECWDALSFPTYQLVDISRELAETMSVFFRGISTFAVQASQRRMRLLKRFFYSPDPIKRWTLILAAKIIFGRYGDNVYQIMPSKANPDCEPICMELEKRLLKSVPECAAEIEYFAKESMKTGILSKRMERTFG